MPPSLPVFPQPAAVTGGGCEESGKWRSALGLWEMRLVHCPCHGPSRSSQTGMEPGVVGSETCASLGLTLETNRRLGIQVPVPRVQNENWKASIQGEGLQVKVP